MLPIEALEVGDMLVALVADPQTAADWNALQGNTDQATELLRGTARLATQVLTDALADDLTIITPLKLGTFLAEITTADLIGYDNSISGYAAITVQDAIDEVASH